MVALALYMYFGSGLNADPAVRIPPPAYVGAAPAAASETAVFAGGCFWGVQAVFQHTKGVLSAESGYTGGSTSSPDYHSVSAGASGHAEAVKVTFDPRLVSYGTLLHIFFSVAHDPTQTNGQGPDTGNQYRSALFFENQEQQEVAQRYIAQLDDAHAFGQKIVTQTGPLTTFYAAEKHHQNYAALHPQSAYIVMYDQPKLLHLKRMFPTLYRPAPVLLALK